MGAAVNRVGVSVSAGELGGEPLGQLVDRSGANANRPVARDAVHRFAVPLGWAAVAAWIMGACNAGDPIDRQLRRALEALGALEDRVKSNGSAPRAATELYLDTRGSLA